MQAQQCQQHMQNNFLLYLEKIQLENNHYLGLFAVFGAQRFYTLLFPSLLGVLRTSP
jgi:hypothetical protein